MNVTNTEFWYAKLFSVAANGETVYPIGSTHKIPTERLLFFSKTDRKIRKKHIYSVASAIHSRKPFLYKYLEELLEIDDSRKIELFARRLFTNWLSVGNEPLFLHNSDFYLQKDS